MHKQICVFFILLLALQTFSMHLHQENLKRSSVHRVKRQYSSIYSIYNNVFARIAAYQAALKALKTNTIASVTSSG